MYQRILFAFALLMPAVALAESPRVVIDTSLGEVVVELDHEHAPITVANFLNYVDEGAYDGSIFHRVISGFMVQGGGRLPDLSTMAEGEMIRNEADNGLDNLDGTIAMARFDDIDSASREFFINVRDNPHLNHTGESCTREQFAAWTAAQERGLAKPLTCKSFGYAVFGHVLVGMDIVHAIEAVPTHIKKGYDDVPVQTVLIKSIKRIESTEE
jgi:peptidyl-prolyl cis-trans isomerase B (cyclophilin B)